MKKIGIGTAYVVAVTLSLFLFFRQDQHDTVSREDSPVQQISPIPPTKIPEPTLTPAVPQKLLPGGTHAYQTFNNCGPAALSMVLSLNGVYVSQEELGLSLRPYQHPQGNNDDKSVTLSELAREAEKRGFVSYYRPAGSIDLLVSFISHDIPMVTRTLLKKDDDIGHYRVVKGYDTNSRELIQDDSLQGKNLTYSYDEFMQVWEPYNYEFLVIVPPEKQDIAIQLLGKLADEQAAWEQAYVYALEQIERSNSSAYPYLNMSVALYHLGRYGESIEMYESVADTLSDRTLWYQIEPILSYYAVGDDDRVMTMTEEILSHDNRAFSELYYVRGLVLKRQGKDHEASEAFQLADMYNKSGSWHVNVEKIIF